MKITVKKQQTPARKIAVYRTGKGGKFNITMMTPRTIKHGGEF